MIPRGARSRRRQDRAGPDRCIELLRVSGILDEKWQNKHED